MIKLAIVISSYEVGGVSSVAKNLIQTLDRGKFNITLIAEKIQRRCFSLPEGVQVINLNLAASLTPWGKIANMIRHVHLLREAVISQDPDLVLSLSYTTSCYLLIKEVEALKDKIIVAEYSENFFIDHGKTTLRQMILRAIYKPMMAFCYKRAKAIVAVSESLGNHIERMIGSVDKEIKVITTGVNIQEIQEYCNEPVCDYAFRDGYFYVGILSRLSAEKGIDYLLRAFARLRTKVPSKLMIIGEGAYRRRLERLSARLGLQEDVTFMGFRDNPFKYLRHLNIFVLPSLYEGSPNVILESYACEVPVVAARSVQGIEEMVEDGKDGILVAPGCSNSIFQALYSLSSDNKLLVRLKDQAKTKVKKYDVSIKTREYEDLFISTVNSN